MVQQRRKQYQSKRFNKRTFIDTLIEDVTKTNKLVETVNKLKDGKE